MTITYSINLASAATSVTGTIVTDGATGVLSSSDIVDWDLVISTPGYGTVDLTGPNSGNDSEMTLVGNDLTATTTGLFFNFQDQTAGNVLYFDYPNTSTFKTGALDFADLGSNPNPDAGGQGGAINIDAETPFWAVIPAPANNLISTMISYVLNYVPTGFTSTASSATLPGQITALDVFNPALLTDVPNSTATQWRLTNPINGFVLVLTGSGFTYDSTNHRATAGTISGIALYADTSLAPQPIATFSSLSGGTSAATFTSDLFGTGQTKYHASTLTWDYIMGGSNTATLNGLSSVDEGTGDDTATVSNSGGYVRPGPGADTIAFGTNSGNNGLLYDDITYAGLTTSGISANLNNNSLTDPWGFTDSWTGQITYIRGTKLADTFIANGLGDTFSGVGGNDSFTGGAGFDFVDYRFDVTNGGSGAVAVDLAAGTATDGFGNTDTFTSIEGVYGTNGDDTLRGGNTSTASTGTNAYVLNGEAGNDTLIAGNYNMFARPGAGNDTITGGPGTDTLSYDDYGGTNGVTVDFNQPTLTDPWGGTDTFSGIEFVRGTRNADTFIAGPNGNTFQGLRGNDTLTGGAGFDYADYRFDSRSGGAGAVTVNLGAGTATDGFGDTDTLSSIEGVFGTSGGDNLTGGDVVVPGGLLYSLLGQGGDDTLTAGSYGTYFEPGGGNDTVVGRAAANSLAVANLFILSYADYGGANGLNIDLSSGSVVDPFGQTDTFSGINGVRGTMNADTLVGTATGTLFQGVAGNDTFTGGAGFDIVDYSRDFIYSGGGGAVTVNLTAGTATDGFGSTDTFTSIEGAVGTSGNDTLTGSSADNRFIGRGGNDAINGGGGRDTAVYNVSSSAATWVRNFNGSWTVNAGTDGIDTLTNVETLQFTDRSVTLPPPVVTISDAVQTSGKVKGVTQITTVIKGHVDINTSVVLSDKTQDGTTSILSSSISPDANGNWSFTTTSLPLGVITFTASATDVSGNTGTSNNLLLGTSGRDTLSDASSGAVFNGNGGNDTVTAGGNNDIFAFHAGFGKETITNFRYGDSSTHDVLEFDRNIAALKGITTDGDLAGFLLSNTQDTKNGAVITVDNSDTVVLQNVFKAQLTASDFRLI